jgi:hypothetical protein
MPQAISQREVRRQDGFDVYLLGNGRVEIGVVPELGGKVVTLKNVVSGREWLWSPRPERHLFRNSLGDPFSQSTLVGWDECLPTIAPCVVGARGLPDHGEVWAIPSVCDSMDWENGVLRTVSELPVSPLTFQRSLTLRGNMVIAEYTLTSRSSRVEHYIWAMHPLINIRGGDRLELGQTVECPVAVEPWFSSLQFNGGSESCAKRFVSAAASSGTVTVVNDRTGDELSFRWDAVENDTLGLWLTRGGWHGHHHLAIEPTNAVGDSLAEAIIHGRCGALAPRATKRWSVTLCLQPSNPIQS